MSNTPVRAAAEGMPNVNRRRLLMGAVAISTVAAVGSVAAPAHAAPISPSLQDALDACQSAEDTYGICRAREIAIAEALGDKVFPEWTPPGGITSLWSHRPKPFRSSSELEAEIARKLEGVEWSFAGGAMNRAAYDRWTRDLANQGHEGMTSLRQQEDAIEASGYNDALQLTDKAYVDFSIAFNAVLRHPCRTLEEVRAKATCLLRGFESIGIEGEDVTICLTSFCADGEA